MLWNTPYCDILESIEYLKKFFWKNSKTIYKMYAFLITGKKYNYR